MRFHEVNFFLKLAGALLLTVGAWFATDWRLGVPLALATLGFLRIAQVPGIKAYLKGAALLVLLVQASWVVNLMLQGQPALQALSMATGMSARLVTTTAAFFFVMETSTPGSILAASSAARLPPVATLVLSLTFGIIPMLRDDFERIADAQRARGMEIDDVGFLVRLRFALARGVPLLVQAIRMAHSISLSLSIHGFDMREKRTTWRKVGLMVEPRLPKAQDRLP
ncbi:energy-coupling factor transport system permease protein [Hoeflea marina]|uniref:Energy-coupling factor transport system permease protein n=1 Tax=Hoeflea marina TaxID=274592 RepID=A0A317PPL8_9HYPH|nr:energy-coupling factor transporter transmembrane component T [Hoeflea marina]PWW01500.1 energy-coupling factor transport system permease protein [Hoeflea marina]